MAEALAVRGLGRLVRDTVCAVITGNVERQLAAEADDCGCGDAGRRAAKRISDGAANGTLAKRGYPATGASADSGPGQWVMLEHQIAQPFVQNMRINLCCRDIGMSKKRLDRTQICPMRQKMRREGVAQRVGRDL